MKTDGDKKGAEISGVSQHGCRAILVRHAIAEGDGRFVGQMDSELTGEARTQLPDLVQQLSGFPVAAVYASDLKRARDTAAAIVDHFGGRLECRAGLREMNFGQWQGLSWDEIEERFPQIAQRWIDDFPAGEVPGGEQFIDFKNRVNCELEFITRANPGRCVVVVTHAGVIRVLLASALGISDRDAFREPLPHCAMRVIDFADSAANLRCVNA